MSTLQQTAETRSQAFVRTYLLGRRAAIAAGVCLVSFAAFWTAQRMTGVSMIDLMVYRAEGWTVRTGGDLYAMRATYADLQTTYPPFGALLFLPLTLLDVPDMRTLATAGNLVLLVTVVHLSLQLIGRPARASRPAASLLIASVAVWCEPVWTTLRYGQINLLLTALVLWDLSRRSGHRWAGVGIGIAAGIKLTPALFAVFLAACGVVQCMRGVRKGGGVGSWWNPGLRQATVATGAFLGTVLLGAIVLPHDSRRFWLDAVFRSERVGHTDITDNQALSGVVARLLHTGQPGLPWLVSTAVVALLGLAVAVAAASAGPRRLPYASAWAAVTCAFTALLVSPVSWSHHWVWCVPAVMLLAAETLRRDRAPAWLVLTGTAALVFCSYGLWLVPYGEKGTVRPELSQSAGEMVLSGLYAAFALGFLAVASTVAVRALRKPAPYEPDSLTGGSTRRTAKSACRPEPCESRRQAVAKE
nr:glycosyltransferase 87 family protein [Streptomyces albidus (ex Kaewkla and Franco 2022)]